MYENDDLAEEKSAGTVFFDVTLAEWWIASWNEEWAAAHLTPWSV